jgi:Ca-activated chloride channel family protein
MLLTSVSVYSFTPPGGASAADIGAEPSRTNEVATEATDKTGNEATGTAQQDELAHFTAGSTVMIEGRMGHPKLVRTAQGETFLMLEARATGAEQARSASPVNLSLVIDRSGSMKGTRLRNAVNAAVGAVERLHDGDVVSVITFDTRTQVVVPAMEISPSTRSSAIASIQSIALGGDTCISCGIEAGMDEMSRLGSGRVSRMIVLSDGDANHGLKDVPGFRSLAQRARDRGIGISTVGVDVDYNEKILSAIAIESNGRHYFVENDAALARVFEGEAEALTQAVASGAEVDIDLAPGVTLERVFDRSFRRNGNRVTVPLGSFSGGDVKTVLMKVRLSADAEGATAVASVAMHYRDLVKGEDGRCEGKLGVEIVKSPAEASEIDAVVAGRVNRSETTAALEEANTLFEQGRVAEAQRRIAEREQALREVAARAKTAAPEGKAAAVAQDFDKQLQVVADARQNFAEPPPAVAAAPAFGGSFASPPAAAPARPTDTREGRSALKKNRAAEVDMGF